jgi:hypothetical protein
MSIKATGQGIDFREHISSYCDQMALFYDYET